MATSKALLNVTSLARLSQSGYDSCWGMLTHCVVADVTTPTPMCVKRLLAHH